MPSSPRKPPKLTSIKGGPRFASTLRVGTPTTERCHVVSVRPYDSVHS